METLLLEMNKREGFRVIGLTTCTKGDLHDVLTAGGIQMMCHVVPDKPRLIYYARHLVFLISFCKKYKVDVVHSHLQQVNIIAVFAQYFMRARVIVFRHHFHDIFDSSFSEKVSATERLFDKLISKLAEVIVVPSGGVRRGMVGKEGVPASKVRILPYIYDFSRYGSPDQSSCSEIMRVYPAKLRLIMVSRLVRLKRHHLVFPIIKELVDNGYEIVLFVLDVGPEEDALKSWIARNNMDQSIKMLGFKRDFINYMAASDVLIQPSLTDASNSVAKEMALLEKVVLVTENVGDYSDYIKDGENGFLVPQSLPQEKIKSILISIYQNKSAYKEFGRRLKSDVMRKFSVEENAAMIDQYLEL